MVKNFEKEICSKISSTTSDNMTNDKSKIDLRDMC